MNNGAELIFFANATLLEGPRWNPETKQLLFVSIEESCVYILSVDTNEIQTIKMSGQVGCANFITNTEVLVAEYNGLFQVDLISGERKRVDQLIEESDIRYNDGVLDSKGRFLVGTTGYNCYAEGRNVLYSWDGKEKKVLVDGTSISNGIAFSIDDKYMYFVDSPTHKVARYNYSIEDGSVKFDKYIIELADGSVPDGICRDSEDMLWVAQWGTGKVSKWNPYTGDRLKEYKLPCKNVSACCLGGQNEEYLYVTTAKPENISEYEQLAGGLFRIRL